MQRTAFPMRWSLLSVGLCCVTAASTAPAEDERSVQEPREEPSSPTGAAEPALEKLLEINAEAIFGGKAKVSDDTVEITFDQDGQMAAGFEGKGIIDSKNELMKGANRNFITIDKKDNKEVLVPGLCAVGMGDGIWTSRFQLAGQPWVELNVRVPNLIGTQSSLRVRVNWDKGSGYETSFFTSVAYVADGNPKSGQTTKLKEFQTHASSWFPRKSKTSYVKAGFGLREGRCVVEMSGKEIAALPRAFDKGGKICIQFSKLTFTIDNLRIKGKLDRKWAEKQIDGLRKAGKLKLKADPPSGS